MSNLGRHIASVIAAAAAWAICATAQAQEIKPPDPYELTDGRMVDLVSLGLTVTTTPILVGVIGQGGLSYSASYVSGAADTWRHSTFGGVYRRQTPTNPSAQPYQWYEVSVPGTSAYFRDDGFGTLEVVEGSGSGTLVMATGSFIYTARDGTIYDFDRSKVAYSPYRSNQGLLTQIRRPDGEIIDYTYTTVTSTGTNSRIQSITNNLGYQLHFDYASDVAGNPGWNRVTKVTAFNMAFDACAPTAFSCTFTQSWPSLTYGSSGSTRTATDSLDRTLRVALTSGRVSGVARPETLSGQNLTYTWLSTLFGDQVATVYDGVGTWTYSRTQPFDPGDNKYSTTTTVADPLNHSRVYDFDWNDPYTDGAIQPLRVNALTSVTNALGHETQILQDAVGVHHITPPEPGGMSTSFSYANGNLASVTRQPRSGSGLSPTSIVATYGDCSTPIRCGRPTSVTDARSNTTTYTYNAFGQVLSETKPAPELLAPQPQTRWSYQSLEAWYKNAAGTIVAAGTQVSRAVGSSACASSAGQIGTTPPACLGTADEILSTTTYQVGGASSASNLLPLSVSNSNGDATLTATTTTTYDHVGNVFNVDGPLIGVADVTRYVYDAMRQQIGVIGPDPDASGGRLYPATRTTYNRDGRPTEVTRGTTLGQSDPAWLAFSPLQTATTDYDAQGRMAWQVTAPGTAVASRTDYAYDAAGNLTCTAQRMNYGASASAACAVTTAGTFGPDRITRNTYDAADRLTQVQTGYGTGGVLTERTQAWTLDGQIDWIEDGAGNRSDYAYDGFDRLSRLYFPLPTVGSHAANTADYEEYGYDASDNPTTKRTRANLMFTTAFDTLNRIASIDAPSGNDVWYRYDNLDRRLSASHGSGTANCATTAVCTTWDSLGRPLTETTALGTMTSTWDLAGRRTELKWPDLYRVKYSYDLDSQMVLIRWNDDSTIIGYGYDNLGRRHTAVRGNGVTTTYGYDAGSRLTSLAHDIAGTTSDITFTYAQSPASQITSLGRSNSTYYYSGALGSATYVNNGRNQIASTPGVVWSWSAQGNLNGDGTRTYSYDAANRLTGTGSSTLSYDPLDRLAEMTGTLGARYQYDGAEIVATYVGGSSTIGNRLVRGPWPNELVASYAFNTPLSPLWTLQDHQSSNIAITDPAGAAIYTMAYDDYGVPRAGNAGRFMYTGQLWMPDYAAYHYKARAYRPDLGRFLQTDPVGYAQGLNLYGYVGNDPVNGTDPTGMFAARVGDVIVNGDRCASGWTCVDPSWFRFISASQGTSRNSGSLNSGSISSSQGNSSLPQDREQELEDAYERDNEICRSLRSSASRQRCFASANQRNGNRRAGRPIGPLDRGDGVARVEEATNAVTLGVVAYWIISEGLRVVFPIRNLVPIP